MSPPPHLTRLIAHQDAECMSDAEIDSAGSIVWSVEEFLAADGALTPRLASLRIRPQRGGRQSERTVDADTLLLMLRTWFNERYRSHALRVAAVHLVRFARISDFLAENRDALEARGWLRRKGGPEELVDGHLLRALVTIRSRPDVRHPAPGENDSRFDLDEVLLLRAAFHEGALEVREFERMAWEREGESMRRSSGRSPDDPSILSPGQLLSALFVLEDWADVRADGWPSLERRLRREFPRRIRTRLGSTAGLRLVLLSWLLWEVELDLESANRAADRVLAVHGFLERSGPRLVEDDLAIQGKLRIRWEPALIGALAYTADERPSPKPPDQEYAGIVAVARALRNYRESNRVEKAASDRGRVLR